MGCTHFEAVSVLRNTNDEILMLISDGFCDVTATRNSSAVASFSEPLVFSRPSGLPTADNSALVGNF